MKLGLFAIIVATAAIIEPTSGATRRLRAVQDNNNGEEQRQQKNRFLQDASMSIDLGSDSVAKGCYSGCFTPVYGKDCPSTANPLSFFARVYKGCGPDVPLGEYCESDGECGTSDDLNNCEVFPRLGELLTVTIKASVYRKTSNYCGGGYIEEPESP